MTTSEDCNYWWLRVHALSHMFKAHRVEYYAANSEVESFLKCVHGLSGHRLHSEVKAIRTHLESIVKACEDNRVPHYDTVVSVLTDAPR